MRASVKDAFRMRTASAAVVPRDEEVELPPELVHGRRSMAAIANSATGLRMSVKPGGLTRSSTLKRGSTFGGPVGDPTAAGVAPVATLRNGLERLMVRLDGPVRRFQAAPMVAGARVLSCERNVQTGMYEVTSGQSKPVLSSPHDYEVVDYLVRELTPSVSDDPCLVSCVAWQRGLPAQGHHDMFSVPLLTGEPEGDVQTSASMTRPMRGASELVFLSNDVTEMDGVRQVKVAFEPQTLFELCANLAEKWPAGDGTTALALTLPCSPTTGRRFHPWKDVKWVPSDKVDTGGMSSLARRLWGR